MSQTSAGRLEGAACIRHAAGMEALEVCGDCGVALAQRPGPTHPYFGASPSCWALYGDVLAREYGNPLYMKVHRLTVDAYAAQHPGKPERRSIQSVWVHLAGLHLILEKGISHDFARRVIGAMTERSDSLSWLDPPARYNFTVADVARVGGAAEHAAAVRRWAEDVWASSSDHHGRVRAATETQLARL